MRKPDVNLTALTRLVERIVPGSGQPVIERTSDGGSTQVYRIRRNGPTYYLRVAEDQEDRLAADALVHRRLLDLGVKVPAIVYLEPYDEALERSILVTTEVIGRSLNQEEPTDVQAVLIAAGRELGVINGVEVAGFGWIKRDEPVVERLEGILPTHRAFVHGELEASLDALRRHFFAGPEIDSILRALTDDADWLDLPQGRLVHGDFDRMHIFHQDGAYTGIIDFGEARGADCFYDLGHFLLHEGETHFAALLEGYQQVTPVAGDHRTRIHRNALLIAVVRLARSVGRPGVAGYQEFMTRAIRQNLRTLTP